MPKFLFTILRPNDLGLRTHRKNCKFANEKFQESDVWLKRDRNWQQLARKHYSDARAPATRRP
jgi:hypothetical protein